MNNQVQPSQNDIVKYNLERQLKSSASWFYWIAALSVINWIAGAFNIDYSFVIGLGATQMIDGITDSLIKQMGSGSAMVLSVIALLGTMSVAGIYALFGYFGSKRATWPFVVGSILYILDALLFLWAGDYLPLIFHAWALFSLLRGPGIIKKLRALEESQPMGTNFQSI
ncbi:MAG: hypothetical protein WBV22_11915 [Anaerolineaceae bacterium]